MLTAIAPPVLLGDDSLFLHAGKSSKINVIKNTEMVRKFIHPNRHYHRADVKKDHFVEGNILLVFKI